MDRLLNMLLEYQRFEKNPRIDGMLREAEDALERTLSDDELDFVSAAGEAEQKPKEEKR